MHKEDVIAYTGTKLLFDGLDVPDTWVVRDFLWLKFEEEII